MSSAALIAGMILFCAGNPTQAAQAEQGRIAVLRVPVSDELRDYLRAEPAISTTAFLGETEHQREWYVNGQSDPSTGKFSLLRLTKSGDPLNPFAFKAGEAEKRADGSIAFIAKAEGKCDLRRSRTSSEGLQQ